MDKPLINVKVLENSEAFSQREEGVSHTSYETETAFYTLVQRGDAEGVREALAAFGKELVVGKLSEDSLRQAKYWAVCCVTLGTRYAIQGGLPEMTAFNLSDKYILAIDKFCTAEEISAYLGKAVFELTTLVRDNLRGDCPKEIRACLDYIDKHLHERISLAKLAEVSGYSGDHVTKLFKRHTGSSPTEYITSKKLEAAKDMLLGGYEQNMIGYYLGFCSQTYFITRFKAAYGVTPHVYARTGKTAK